MFSSTRSNTGNHHEYHYQRLQELWISSSELSTFAALEPLCKLTLLNCVYLEHSPIGE